MIDISIINPYLLDNLSVFVQIFRITVESARPTKTERYHLLVQDLRNIKHSKKDFWDFCVAKIYFNWNEIIVKFRVANISAESRYLFFHNLKSDPRSRRNQTQKSRYLQNGICVIDCWRHTKRLRQIPRRNLPHRVAIGSRDDGKTGRCLLPNWWNALTDRGWNIICFEWLTWTFGCQCNRSHVSWKVTHCSEFW